MASAEDFEPMIHLYAEHLQNIRTLSIQASLATVTNKETQATLSADGALLILQHEGKSASIRLPLSLGDHSDATLTIPAAPTKELSFRLNVQEKPGEHGQLGSNEFTDGPIISWMSGDLTTETEVQCAACGVVYVPRRKVAQWKDLPSDGWAEMMEFWHCHKPDVPHDHDHDHARGTNNASRGFSANSTLSVHAGVGLVGPTDFLLAPNDCQNIEMSDSPSATASIVQLLCQKCHVPVGILDHATGGYKLRKSRLALSLDGGSETVSYSYEKWLSCSILSSAESQGVHRLLVHDSGDTKDTACVMHIWLFAPDIMISSSAAKTTDAMRVAKILYKPGTASDIDKLDGMSSTEGELELDRAEWQNLATLLEHSSKLLPPKARTFQDWTVGLLARFTEADIKTT